MASHGLDAIRFDDARGRRLLIALSGGADSVALLALLCARREADGFALAAAHFHHGIRGADADGDAEFCRELCARLGVQLIEGRGDVPALARAHGIGLEAAAREARYAFLREAQTRCAADWIALAHHMDDQAETVLMHLLRGAGPDGACGMARLERSLYRPLLDVPKASLRKYLEDSGIPWREDVTNADPGTPRNALRLNVLPEIEKSYPSAAAALARHAKAARIERDFLEKLTDVFLRKRLESGPYGRRLRMDGSEEEALIRRALRRLHPELNAERLEALSDLAQRPRGALELPGKTRAERTPGWLYLMPAKLPEIAPVPLKIPGETHLPGLAHIRAELGEFPLAPDDPNTELLDPGALRGAVLRTRRSGDRFHPLGAPGDRLLSDYLIDRRIDRPLRDCLPLVAVEGRALWVCGVGLSETAKLKSPSQRCVRLTMIPVTDDKS